MMAPSKKRAKKDDTDTAIKNVKESTKKAISSLENKFEKQFQEMKELLMASKAENNDEEKRLAEEKVRKQQEEEIKRKNAEEEEARLKASNENMTAPTQQAGTSTGDAEPEDEDQIGKLLTAVLGVKKGKESVSTDSKIYEPYLIRGAICNFNV